MRHVVDVVDRIEGADGSGGRPLSDVTLETVFASIERKVESVEDEFGRVDTVVVHHIETRYTPNITEDKNLVFDNRELKILSVNNVLEMNRELWIRAVEGTPSLAQTATYRSPYLSTPAKPLDRP